jgi:superfamily II DNA/RNA helicase
MISETLAGTNAGASEVSLTDTSSTPSPSSETAPAGAAQPRAGWWRKRAIQAGEHAVPPEDASRGENSAGQNGQAVAAGQPSASGFDRLGLSADLLKAVAEAGYNTPTPIQAQGIPEVLKHRDIIGIAQTGTGKTASFTLPMIELLARGRAKARMPRSLILEPTRELAAQVAESFEKYGKYNKLSMALLIGGTSFDDQDKKLDRGVDVLIATPGRLLDHFERGKLMLSQVSVLVIDEADRMLDMGFIPDVEKICKLIPFTRQTLFYSATMPPEIRRLTDQFLHHPVRVEVARPATTAANVKQEAVDVPANDWAKREALRRLVREAGDITNAIVFCNRKRDVDVVAKSLKKHGFNAAPLHGDLDQSVRTRTLDAFRTGEITILVASDVAARGLDIPAVSHIFNFDVPFHADDYVHRIGRTGRAGRSGHTLMLVTSRDAKYLDAIERLTGNKIERRTLEGLAEAVQARPHDEHRGHGRDRNRGSSHRERKSHSRPVKDHGQRASMEPVAPSAAEADAPQPQHHTPKPHHHAPKQHNHPHPKHSRDKAPAKHAHPKPVQPAAEKKPDAHQLPPFLLRPVPLPKEKPAASPRTKVKATV